MLFSSLNELGPTIFLAYLDPGLGSMQFQIIVAGLLSAGFFVKSYMIQARHWVGRICRREVQVQAVKVD